MLNNSVIFYMNRAFAIGRFFCPDSPWTSAIENRCVFGPSSSTKIAVDAVSAAAERK